MVHSSTIHRPVPYRHTFQTGAKEQLRKLATMIRYTKVTEMGEEDESSNDEREENADEGGGATPLYRDFAAIPQPFVERPESQKDGDHKFPARLHYMLSEIEADGMR